MSTMICGRKRKRKTIFSSEVNKQLRDENDSLRAMIESRKLLISPPEVNQIDGRDVTISSMTVASRCFHHQSD